MLTVLLVVVLGLFFLVSAFFFFVGERGWLRKSTREFFREGGLRLQTLHGYIYSRWTKQYIKVLFNLPPTKSNAGENWLAMHYHGKVLTHEHARAIVCLNQPVERRGLDQIVPYPIARDLILKAPPEMAAYECVCRNNREHHCEPTQVCMIVGQPFVDFALEHHPDKARRLTREEALALLEAERARGHVHSAWFKDAMMGRFYAICNCCKCCCGGIFEMAQRSVPMVASSGFVAQVETEACANCGDCVTACPFGAMNANDDHVISDWERCMGCGVCESMCQTGAVTLVRDERKGVPLDVRAMA